MPAPSKRAWRVRRCFRRGSFKLTDRFPLAGGFFRAILAIHNDQYAQALKYIDRTRDMLETELAALVGESYSRAYKLIVRVQQLSEMEEIIEYKQNKDRRHDMRMPTFPLLPANVSLRFPRPVILQIWEKRLQGVERSVETWQALLAVRSLVLPPIADMRSWLKFASLCRYALLWPRGPLCVRVLDSLFLCYPLPSIERAAVSISLARR